jgi:simple sugar transport system ATP-binding protein
MTMAPIVEMKQVTKLYRGVAAVKSVDFDLQKGEIHALLGENGGCNST